MAIERVAGGTSLIDVLDRVLDKGIVIDAWLRVSLVGIDLLTVEARIVVASIDTYLRYSEAVGQVMPASRPTFGSRASLPSAPKKDDDNGNDGSAGGSSGAPAMVHAPLAPRKPPASRPPRTRRRRE